MHHIYNCMYGTQIFIFFHNLFHHIQHAYYIYGDLCVQVADIGQICFHIIRYYAAKALTAFSCMHKDAPQYFYHHNHSSVVCRSNLRASSHNT